MASTATKEKVPDELLDVVRAARALADDLDDCGFDEKLLAERQALRAALAKLDALP